MTPAQQKIINMLQNGAKIKVKNCNQSFFSGKEELFILHSIDALIRKGFIEIKEGQIKFTEKGGALK